MLPTLDDLFVISHSKISPQENPQDARGLCVFLCSMPKTVFYDNIFFEPGCGKPRAGAGLGPRPRTELDGLQFAREPVIKILMPMNAIWTSQRNDAHDIVRFSVLLQPFYDGFGTNAGFNGIGMIRQLGPGTVLLYNTHNGCVISARFVWIVTYETDGHDRSPLQKKGF
jgi:hypothetical protein